MDIEIPVQFLFYNCVTGKNVINFNGTNIIIPPEFKIHNHEHNHTIKIIKVDKSFFNQLQSIFVLF